MDRWSKESSVTSRHSQASIAEIVDLLTSMRKKGVRLWSKDGQLHCRAPKGALAPEEFERLRLSKGQIMGFLRDPESGLGFHQADHLAPLAFSQLAHWHFYELNRRRSIRQVASATRMRGPLNLDALRSSLAEIVRRHEALRTRIVTRDGTPMQEIDQTGGCELETEECAALSESSQEREVTRAIEQLILEPVDVAVDRLLAVRLVRLRADEHVLIVAMEHMIGDLFSMDLLLRDMSAAYMQISSGRAVSLPSIPVQFADYAAWQRSGEISWVERHGAYWKERLASCQRLRFPEEKSTRTIAQPGWGTVPIRIGVKLTMALRQWCRFRQTTMVLAVFTAYVGAVLRWCSVPEAVFRYTSDGRVSAEIENTIGYFAGALYLRIELAEDSTFLDLLSRVTEEYCRACEHTDCSYLMTCVPQPGIARNTLFNWVPHGSFLTDSSSANAPEEPIRCSPIRFAHPLLRNLLADAEPSIQLADTDGARVDTSRD